MERFPNRKGGMKRFVLILAAVSLISFSSPAFAASIKASPWTTQTSYADKTSHKLGFGLLNFATGWTELFWRPSRAKNKLTGIAEGIFYTITDSAGGALHILTFPVPLDVPLPDGGIQYEA